MDKFRFENGNVLVGFELPATVPATTVTVCGDFNGWESEAHPLARLADGRFRAEIVLPPGGRRRFRYLLDGQNWQNAPDADDYVPNGLGTDDSVVDLTAPEALPAVGTAALPAAPANPAGSSPKAPEDARPSHANDEGGQHPGVQRLRLRPKTWQLIEIEAATRGIESQDLVAHLLEVVMSPRLWPTVNQLVHP